MASFHESKTSADSVTSENESILDAEKLKKTANEYFAQKKYKEAEDTYTLALANHKEEISPASIELRSVILANRAAARIALSMFELALSDAEEAIRLNNAWVKAYFRKSSALEGMGKYRQAIETWEDAERNCPALDHASIEKQLKLMQKKWMNVFLQEPIESDVDLLSRYSILSDKRERLSTLAHFWNDSSKTERYSYFLLLISIIGGDTGLSESNMRYIVPEVMVDMPLQNYPDLPRERIQLWVDYFSHSLDSDSKKTFFEAVWNKILTSEEQHDVISDLKLLVSEAVLPGSSATEID